MHWQLDGEKKEGDMVGSLALQGKATFQVINSLKEALRQGIKTCDLLIVNCAEINDIDCPGMQLLCSVHRSVAQLGKKLHVQKLKDGPLEGIMREAGFYRSEPCTLVSQKESCLWCWRYPVDHNLPDKQDDTLLNSADLFAVPKSGNNAINPPKLSENEVCSTYRIRYRPEVEVFKSGVNPVTLFRNLAKLGTTQVMVHTERVPGLKEIDPEECYLYWDIILNTGADEDTIRKQFYPSINNKEVHIEILETGGLLQNGRNYKKLAEILVERGDLDPEVLETVLGKRKLIGEVLVEAGLIQPGHVLSAVAEQEAVRSKFYSGGGSSNVSIPTQHLEKMSELLVDLVTAQSRLSRTSAERRDIDFLTIGSEIERLTAELWDITSNFRVPLQKGK